jgi:hypothetical protein
LDGDRIARAIELTRFRVPDDDDHAETDSELGLVRATDLIGQLADPRYPQKAESAESSKLKMRGSSANANRPIPHAAHTFSASIAKAAVMKLRIA